MHFWAEFLSDWFADDDVMMMLMGLDSVLKQQHGRQSATATTTTAMASGATPSVCNCCSIIRILTADDFQTPSSLLDAATS